MKRIFFLLLVLGNLLALHHGADIFVTFADVPAQVAGAQIGQAHAHHEGMENMRDFLLPSFVWITVMMGINFVVAGVFIFAWGRKEKGHSKLTV